MRKIEMLRSPFHGKEIKANFRKYVPNHLQKGKQIKPK
jgi:hypothetical protein